ncbi:MAG: CPBP family intramembrane glutamic endopeptidase [Planctomycetota bacterium]
MSNALSPQGLGALLASAGSATRPQTDTGNLHEFQLILLAAGVCALMVWTVRRIAHPRKLALQRTPGRPNTINPLHVVLGLLVWQGVGGATAALLFRRMGPDAPRALILSQLAAQAALLPTTLLLAAATFRNGLRRGMGLSLRHWPWDLVRGILGYLVAFPVCIALLALARWVMPEAWVRPHPALTALQRLSPAWQVVTVVTVVVLAPLAEETFFRGLLQSMLRRYTRRPWAAIVLTSACFAAAHMANPDQVPPLFALAVVLGYNYERTGRLTSPLLIHAVFNAVTLIAWFTRAA